MAGGSSSGTWSEKQSSKKLGKEPDKETKSLLSAHEELSATVVIVGRQFMVIQMH